MTPIELSLDGGCTVVFVIEGKKDDYVYFDIELHFDELRASLPAVRGCSLSGSDIQRLAAYAEAALMGGQEEEHGPFAAYDAFFTIEFLEDDAVRFMASYGPQHPFSLGIEGTVSESSLMAFRDGWLLQLADS